MIPYLRKALTIYSPWAELLVLGVKPAENRTKLPHRDVLGRFVLLHVGLRRPSDDAVRWAVRRAPPLDGSVLRLGMILGAARLVGVVEDGARARSPRRRAKALVWPPENHELRPAALEALRAAEPGRCTWFDRWSPVAWLFDSQVAFESPLASRGQQFLWVPSQPVLAEARLRMAAAREDTDRCARCGGAVSAYRQCQGCATSVCVDNCFPAALDREGAGSCERCMARLAVDRHG